MVRPLNERETKVIRRILITDPLIEILFDAGLLMAVDSGDEVPDGFFVAGVVLNRPGRVSFVKEDGTKHTIETRLALEGVDNFIGIRFSLHGPLKVESDVDASVIVADFTWAKRAMEEFARQLESMMIRSADER